MAQQQSNNIGPAIVLATIIGVGGFWGGKVAYDLFQEWRIEQAMKDLAQKQKVAERKARVEQQRRLQAAQRQAQAHQQARTVQKRQQADSAEKARRDKIWNSRACKFWWEHDPKNPAVIAKARTMQTCQR